MIVGAVQIDQFVTKILKNAERGGRSVDKLPIRSRSGKTPLHDKFAGIILDPGFVEQGLQLLEISAFKNGFDCAGFRPGADQRFICAFAEEQLKRANNDRFAGARFARDSGESRPKLPLQVFHQREIFDPQKAERGGHLGKKLRVESY